MENKMQRRETDLLRKKNQELTRANQALQEKQAELDDLLRQAKNGE